MFSLVVSLLWRNEFWMPSKTSNHIHQTVSLSKIMITGNEGWMLHKKKNHWQTHGKEGTSQTKQVNHGKSVKDCETTHTKNKCHSVIPLIRSQCSINTFDPQYSWWRSSGILGGQSNKNYAAWLDLWQAYVQFPGGCTPFHKAIHHTVF